MKQILVIKPSSLGDIIHALMVVEALRRQRPQLQVDWVARDIFAPFVDACRTVRRTHVFWRKGGLGPFRRLVKEIRGCEYDAVLDMQGLARSGVLSLLSGVPRGSRYGRSDARELSWLAAGQLAALPRAGAEGAAHASSVRPENSSSSEPARVGQEAAGDATACCGTGGTSEGADDSCKAVHAVDILRQFLPFFGVPADVALGKLEFTAGTPSAAVSDVLARGRKLVLLFPESRRPEKEWAGFAALTDLLLAEGAGEGARPLVCWLGSSAVADGERWPAADFINLTGRTSIAELPLLVQSASVVVANDSGPMHLAAAMEKPLVALFGPTDPRRYGPYPLDAPGHCVLRAPSGLLADIAPQQVATAVGRLLEMGGLAADAPA